MRINGKTDEKRGGVFMKWNQKGMIACVILFFLVLGGLLLQPPGSRRQETPSVGEEEEIIPGQEGTGQPEASPSAVSEKTSPVTPKPKEKTPKRQKGNAGPSAVPEPSATVGNEKKDTAKKNSGKGFTEGKRTKKRGIKKSKTKKTETEKPSGNTPQPVTPRSAVPTQKPREDTVSLEIECRAVLGRKDLWREGIEEIIPQSGVFYSGQCSYVSGETAYDLLKRICRQKEIALDCSYTPLYGSYYIRGIGNLYEFDCGSESGWKYKVNGVTPGVGSSQYVIKNQDCIVFYYDYLLERR